MAALMMSTAHSTRLWAAFCFGVLFKFSGGAQHLSAIYLFSLRLHHGHERLLSS
jgi:hypothetical protein